MARRRPLAPPRRQPTPLKDERPRGARIVPDWPAYFEQFCRAHQVEGGGPVVDGGALLFGDGWRYSAEDYAGPELPPPRDPADLTALLRRYWLRRRQICRAQRDGLAHQLEGLTALARDRPLPVLVRNVVLNEWGMEVYGRDGEGNPVPSAEPDWAHLVGRLNWLIADCALCDRELEVLGGGEQ